MFACPVAVLPAILSCVLVAIALGQEAANQEQPSQPVEVLRKRFSCAPNCLYLFLRLHGQKVTLDEVDKVVFLGTKGTSLLQLKEAAARLGMQTQIYRCTWDELIRCPKPAIAYLCHSNEASAGHYVAVLDADREKNVDFIDGSDGVLYHNRHGFFIQGWTGYLLIPVTPSEPHWDIIVILAFWVSLGFIVWLTGPTDLMATLFWRTGQRPFRALLVVLGLLPLLLYPREARGVQPSIPSPPSDTSTVIYWRTSENDGLTCLYVLLALDGYPVNYADLREEITAKGSDHGRSGMVALRQVAQHHGLNLDIRKCGIKELTAEHLPTIALAEATQETSSFVLVLWFADDRCGIVDGYGRFNQVSVDDFRRRFTGYVLVRQTPPRLWIVFTGIGGTVLIGYGWWRIRPTWQLLRGSHLEIGLQKGE